jgi:hypothetical protein
MQGKHGTGERRLCAISDCTNRVQHASGLCNRHHDEQRLAGVTCAEPGCDRQAKRRGFCGRHYRKLLSGRAECSTDACTNAVYSKGLCQTHWKERRFAGMVCAVPGCRRQQVNAGRALCWLHYKHHLAIGRFCTVEGCNRPLRNAGLCTGHYRQRREGVPLTPIAERREPGTGSINRLGYKEITVAPKVRRLEHRVVMEQILGRELKSSEHVHHRNGDRLDNRPQNLELWTVGQPNGQRVRDLLDWLARDYPALFLSQATTAITELGHPSMTGVVTAS